MRGRLLAALVVSVAVASCGDDTESSDTFRSPVYGYEMAVPIGWSTLPANHELEPGEAPLLGPLGTDVVAARAARTVQEMTLPAIVVGAQPVDAGTDLEEWADEVADIVAGFKGCADPASTDDITVGDEPAILLTYPDCPEGLGLDHRWVALVEGDRGFQFVWFDESGGGAADRSQFEQILSTVSFAS